MSPAVSVITPAFNYGRYLSEAVASLTRQSSGDWECIIVNDGSTDDTAEVADALAARDCRVKVIHQNNRGVSAARNRGIAAATGRYIQLLDADDRLDAQKLALHVDFLDRSLDVDIVYGLATFFRDDNPDKILFSLDGKLSEPLMQRVYSSKEALAKLEEINIMVEASPLIRRSVFDRAGLFSETVHGCEDWDFWLRCAIAGVEFRFLDSPPVAYIRTHSQSASRNQERMIQGLIAAANAFPGTSAAALWQLQRLPLIYEAAIGYDTVTRGQRIKGARRLLHAAKEASPLTRIRWIGYASAAMMLPSRLFRRFIAMPVPEVILEFVRHFGTSRSI